MSELVIQAAIQADTISTTAAVVYAADPNSYVNASGVPNHIYTCLASMLTAFGPLTTIVTISQGEGTNTTAGIIIEPSRSFESGSESFNSLMDNNEAGAEKARVRITVKGIRTGTSSTLVRDVGLRIWYILDNANRSKEYNAYMTHQAYQEFDTSMDNTILSPLCGGYFKMARVRADELSVGEWCYTYSTDFVRNMGS